MLSEFPKFCEQAIIQAMETAGITGLTNRAYHVEDDIGDEDIVYPVCQIVAEPVQEIQQDAPLYECRVSVSIATYFDDDGKRQILSNLSSDVWLVLTRSNIDTAMGLVVGGTNLGVQGVTYADVTTNQDSNDQRSTRVFSLHLFDAT